MRITVTRLLTVLLVGALYSPITSSAQAPVAGDAIRCWWRSTAGFVETGENFTVVLTCAVLETDSVRVLTDETQLDPTTISLTPFEVIGGSQPPDLHTDNRRFFQRSYNLRIINPDAIGKDIRLPPLAVHYRIQNRAAGAATVEGRDLIYLLPPQPIKVLSVVPEDASDIRDGNVETFDEIPSMVTRGNILKVAAFALIGVGAIMTVLGLYRLAARRVNRPKLDATHVSPRAVLAAVRHDLAEVQREAGTVGWTDSLVGRALAALRLAAGCALQRGFGQRVPTVVAPAVDGQLLIGGGRKRATAVSSGSTAEDIRRELARVDADSSPERRQHLADLEAALAAFTSARFGRETTVDGRPLDEALGAAIRTVEQLASQHAWPASYLRLRRVSTPALEGQA